MIYAINYENVHHFGLLFPQIFRLRYREFIERQSYDVRSYQEMEYDQYDTPAACYLTYADPAGEVLATSRLTPTTQGCMLRDIWPHLVEDKNLLQSDDVWEGTRYCIDKNVSSADRQRIIHEMAIAYLEFGLQKGLRRIIGMMPTYIYRRVFERPGIEMEYLGPVQQIGRHNIRAVAIPVEKAQLERVREKTGLNGRILKGFKATATHEYEVSHARAA